MVTKPVQFASLAGLYAVMIAVVVYATFRARQAALEELSAPEAQAEWTEWRSDVQQGGVADDGAVSRRTPASAEPPWLVLMRNHFAVCLAAAVFFSTLLFAVTAFFIAAARKPSPEDVGCRKARLVP